MDQFRTTRIGGADRRGRPQSPVRRRAARSSAAAPVAGADLHDRPLEPGGVGNGWREEMICSAKAQADKAGNVSKVTVIHRDTDAAGQLADIRDLIAQNVDAIIINPATRPRSTRPSRRPRGQGIVVVAIDASVTAPEAYNLSNDQEQYAYLGASWLFKQLGGKGAVVYMRGIAGHPADTDRDTGFKKALAENPGITVAKETVTKWDQATACQQINDIIAAAWSSTASGRRASTTSSSTRSRPRSMTSCRSSARTARAT